MSGKIRKSVFAALPSAYWVTPEPGTVSSCRVEDAYLPEGADGYEGEFFGPVPTSVVDAWYEVGSRIVGAFWEAIAASSEVVIVPEGTG